MGKLTLETFRENLKHKGVRIHGNNYARELDMVVAVKDVIGITGESIKGQVFRILEIVVESQHGNGLGFSKKIKLSGHEDKLFNPQKFVKVLNNHSTINSL